MPQTQPEPQQFDTASQFTPSYEVSRYLESVVSHLSQMSDVADMGRMSDALELACNVIITLGTYADVLSPGLRRSLLECLRKDARP